MEKIRNFFKALSRDLVERFFNFKTIDAVWQAPIGCVIVYFAIYHVEHVIAAYFGARGVQMAYTGLYDFITNPVKREALFWNKVEKRQEDVGKPTN